LDDPPMQGTIPELNRLRWWPPSYPAFP